MAASVGNEVIRPGGTILEKLLFGLGYRGGDTGNEQMDQIARLFGGGGGPFSLRNSSDATAWGGAGGFSPSWQGSPNKGAFDYTYGRLGDAGNNFNRWFTTDAGGLNSPLHAAGNLVNASYGQKAPYENSYLGSAWGRYQGQANQGADNPLSPEAQLGLSHRLFNRNSGFIPNPDDYIRKQQFLNRVNPEGDFYGQRGLGQVQGLTNQYENDLNANIDRQSQLTLANQLPEVQAQMQAQGLGMSGAGARGAGDVMRSVLEQANRDKMQQMANFRSQNLGRISEAINLGSNLGAQGGQFNTNLLSQANQLGQTQRFGAGSEQAAREQGILGQALGNQNQRDLALRQQNLQAILAGDQSNLERYRLAQSGQLGGIQAVQGLYGLKEGTQSNRLNQYLAQVNQYNQQNADRLNQIAEYKMLPYKTLMQILTGIQAPATPQSRPSIWQQAAPGLINAGVQGYTNGIFNGTGT